MPATRWVSRVHSVALLALAAAILALATSVAAQDRTEIRRGDRVRLVTEWGTQVEGRVDQTTESSIVIRDGSDEHIVSRSQVRQAWIATSTGGSARGLAALIGGAFGGAVGHSFYSNVCDSGCSDSSSPFPFIVAGAAGGALLGLVIGGLAGGSSQTEWANVTEGARSGSIGLRLGVAPQEHPSGKTHLSVGLTVRLPTGG